MKLTLTDRSITMQRESSTALGQGCRLGFLGTLHMDVFRQRLEDEYDANVIITAPTVPYKSELVDMLLWLVWVLMMGQVVYKDREVIISNPTDFPEVGDAGLRVKEVHEPVVKASIIVPEGVSVSVSCHLGKCLFNNHFPDYFGDMMDLCYAHRAEELEHRYLDSGTSASPRIMLNCILPLSEIVTEFFDQLKSRSSGFASFE
jgi:translation elongation factor EF-4